MVTFFFLPVAVSYCCELDCKHFQTGLTSVFIVASTQPLSGFSLEMNPCTFSWLTFKRYCPDFLRQYVRSEKNELIQIIKKRKKFDKIVPDTNSSK